MATISLNFGQKFQWTGGWGRVKSGKQGAITSAERNHGKVFCLTLNFFPLEEEEKSPTCRRQQSEERKNMTNVSGNLILTKGSIY